jgi:AcrR family transcriptional regulator
MSERRRGAARSEAARTAILKATAILFTARGYEHLTIEGIAAEARVGKQTIYRWWPSKGALVAECLLEGQLLPAEFVLPDTGNIRADLTTWLGKLFGYANQPGNNAVLCSLIAAAAENEDVGHRLRESLGAASALSARLNAAVEAAELRREAPVQEIGEALVGAVILHVLTRTRAAPGLARRLVDAVLR